MKVLIAEDDATSRKILQTVLERQGFEVDAYVDGRSALEAFKAVDAPKLAVLDWMMPEMDGPEVVRSLKVHDRHRNVYTILLTAKDRREDVVAGLEAGADDYVTKPFDRSELEARVRVGVRMIALQDTLARRVEELEQAMSEIKTLKGLVPICASCKKIRDDDGYWQEVEAYLSEHATVEFSHGMCPDCMGKYYPEYENEETPTPEPR